MAARAAPGCDSRTRPGRSAVAKRDLLVNVRLPDGRDEVFRELWAETSRYFRAQPGFVGLKLHRAVSVDAEHRYVNVVVWDSAAAYAAPHQTDEFRRLVTQEGMREFPTSPTLYEVAVEHSLAVSTA